MKRIVSTILGLAILAITNAAHAVPDTVGFTGRLSNQDGTPVTGSVTFVFTLFAEPAGGAPVWSEVRPNLGTSGAGLVFVDLGAVTPFGDAAFAGGDRWLEVSVEGEILTPRLRVHAVPYAMQAANADTVGGLAPDELGDITGVLPGPGLAGGSASGDAMLAVDTSAIQARVTGTCAPGSSIASITAAGTVTCENDDDSGGDITGVTAGFGLTGGAMSGSAALAVDASSIQRRVSGTCTNGAMVTRVNSDGTVVCAAPANPLASCTWARSTTFAIGGHVLATCPSGRQAISGGCVAAGTAVVRGTAPTGASADGTPASDVAGWTCGFSATVSGNAAYALCCTF